MHLLIVLVVTAGPAGAAAPLLHFTAASDTTTLASEQGAGQTESVTKVTAARGGTRTRTRAPVAWESHLGRVSEWMEEEGGMERMHKKGRWRP